MITVVYTRILSISEFDYNCVIKYVYQVTDYIIWCAIYDHLYTKMEKNEIKNRFVYAWGISVVNPGHLFVSECNL